MALALVPAVSADPIPYPNAGTTNSTTYTFTADATGDVIAYFLGQTAGYGSMVGLSINGAAPLVYGLQNHMSAYGEAFNLGSVNAGDILRFILNVSTDNYEGPPNTTYLINSDASLNPGGENFIYSTSFVTDGVIPTGTYIGFEDIMPGGGDLDYDDHQFVFTNVRANTHGAPDSASTLALMGLALAGLIGLRRRLAV
jgi:hypothetical protein